ncbi:Smr/MutS family protein [Candidatus Puniceispirillum sp.]|nr:Smr/MutS family protein [Candidatus Puniceispirillum sp.]
MAKIPIIDSDDDMVLWQRVVSQVKPLKSTIQSAETYALFVSPEMQEKTLPKNSRSVCNKTRVFSKGAHLSSFSKKHSVLRKTEPVDLRQGERAGIDGGTQKRLFRGEVLVDRRIDLHGLTTVNAESKLKQFIEIASYDGCRCVLVITGKGAGVLQRHVPNWLKKPPLAPHVLALAEARPKDGGGGALYVLLRRKRNG